MKELIKKVLREEVQKKFIKSNANIERTIVKIMDDLLSETTRIIPPPDENYGIYIEEWCKGGVKVVEARYHLDDDTDEFFSGDLYVDSKEIEFLSNMFKVRKSYILNVISEWYDEKYASKFGPEVNHPEFEIFEAFENDDPRKCYQMIDVDNMSRDVMIDYLDTQTLHKRNDLEKLSNDELKSKYRSVYNSRLNT